MLTRFALPRASWRGARALSAGASVIRVDSPYSGEIVAEVPLASSKEAAAVVDAAKRAQVQWRSSSLPERVAVCQQFLKNVEANRDVIAKVRGDTGAPVAVPRPRCPRARVYAGNLPANGQTPVASVR